MVTNRASAKGFITEGPVDGSVANVFEGNVTFTEPLTVVPNWELLRDINTQTFTGDGIHHLVQLHGDYHYQNNGSSWWSTSSHTFSQAKLDEYT